LCITLITTITKCDLIEYIFCLTVINFTTKQICQKGIGVKATNEKCWKDGPW
jgi:hypothetical protein